MKNIIQLLIVIILSLIVHPVFIASAQTFHEGETIVSGKTILCDFDSQLSEILHAAQKGFSKGAAVYSKYLNIENKFGNESCRYFSEEISVTLGKKGESLKGVALGPNKKRDMSIVQVTYLRDMRTIAFGYIYLLSSVVIKPRIYQKQTPKLKSPLRKKVTSQLCKKRGLLQDRLFNKFGESIRAAGLSLVDTPFGTGTEVLVAKSGSWSIVTTDADGLTCFVIGGSKWKEIPKEDW